MRELSEDRCRLLLAEALVGHLAVDAEEPYVTPISFVLIEGSLCFRTGEGRKVKALRSHPRVCVEVSHFDIRTGEWESVIAWGNAQEVTDGRLAQRIVGDLLAKYGDVLGSPLSRPGAGGRPITDIVLVSVPIDTVSGRASGSLFDIPLRPGRL